MSLSNVTVASGNDTPAITYAPALCNGQGWSLVKTDDLSGSYRTCTLTSRGAAGPSANFTFTGVSVYYLVPFLDGQLVNLTLDDAQPVTVNLSNTAGPGSPPPSLAQIIMWNATSLENSQHILQLNPLNGSRTLSVGSFIVSQQAEPVVSSNVSTPLVTGLSPALASELAALAPPSQSAKTTRVAIALGTTFGALSFIIFLFISLFLWRRNNAVRKRYSWNRPVPPIRSSIKPTTVQSRSQSLESFPSPKTTGSNMPMNPIASVEPGVSVQEFDGDEPSGSKGWVSPALSHSPLVASKPPSTAYSRDDSPPAPSAYHKLQPLRALSESGSVSGHSAFGQALVSRNTTVSSRLEPVRAPSVQSYTQRSPPPPFSETAYIADMTGGTTVSRNTTFNSARLEPVRRGSSATPVPER